MSEYGSTGVAEIRDKLRERGVTDEDVLAQTKKPLVDLLIKLEEEDKAEQETTDIFKEAQDEPEVLDKAGETPLPIPEVVPSFGSSDWHDYVIRQFEEYELDNGNPNCVGCRRLVMQFIGKILSAQVVDYTPPSDKNRATGTVIFQIEIHVTNKDHPSSGITMTISDIADVNKFNTDPPYHKHACATAATRAESRIYRKLLGLNKITAEEASKVAENDEEWVQDDVIDEGQISVINMLCSPQRCDLSVVDYINCGQSKYKTIYAVPRSIAAKMIQKLNDIQQGNCVRPDNVGRYEANWRDK
jgi:hypothetical protein